MKCFVPNCKTPKPMTLHRINAKGQPGIWACPVHVKNTDATIDPVVREITETLVKP